MRRAEIGTTKRHSWWLELISSEWASANEYIKSHSGKVADVMTRNVITAKPDTPLGDIAGLLERNRIKRVPIVEGAKLVGIVSRANILQALASATKKTPILATTDDSELRRKVVSRLASEPWRPTMTTGYALADVATKVAYFSLTAAAFIFVSMLLLTGLHP